MVAKILYSGQIITISSNVDVDRLADVVLETCAKGAHSLITLQGGQSNEDSIKLLVGPGIPFAVLDDKALWQPSKSDIQQLT